LLLHNGGGNHGRLRGGYYLRVERINQSLMYNHFLEFSVDEMVDAYTYFDHIHDYEGCRLVGAAFAQNTSIDFQNF
jgi:hypothetical protein